jgi:UDP-N-acetylglucosamine acyltransferase
MSLIHPTALIDPKARIGRDVQIGAFSVIGPDVELADRVRLHTHVVVEGHTLIGEETEVFPFSSIGQAPQIYKYQGGSGRLRIGARCQIREYVTINTGSTKADGLTTIGDDCMLMMGAHVAHDCSVGKGVIMIGYAGLAGHCEIGDYAILSGHTGVHQYVRIGESAFVGALCAVENDVIPFGMVYGNRAVLEGLNLIGLKRRGFERDSIHALRKAYRLLFTNEEGTLKERVDEVSAMFPDDPLVNKVLDFIRAGGERAICTPRNGRAG